MEQLEDSNTTSYNDSHSPDQPPISKKTSLKRRARKPRQRLSCEPCRRSKLRCDRQHPCGTCQQRDRTSNCIFNARNNGPSTPTDESIRRLSRPLQPTSRPNNAAAMPHSAPSTRDTSEDVGASEGLVSDPQSLDSTCARWDAVLRRPAVDRSDSLSALENLFVPSFTLNASLKESLLQLLPSEQSCEYLISEYFMRLSPLFHILHGPTFEQQYSLFRQNPKNTTFSWLALLFIICSVTLNTFDHGDPVLADLFAGHPQFTNTVAMARQLRKASLTCLAEDHFLVHHDLNTLETILILTYSVCHNEGVERGWILLGMALNMGIALRCNVNSVNMNCIETERRRRCWAGILMLHTYQAILFRDIDMSFLLDVKATMPAEVNDTDIHEDKILQTTSQPSQTFLMKFKLRLFRLSTELCCHISGPSKLDHALLKFFNNAVAEEEQLWDSTLLVNGSPSLLNNASYAHWCILETYAHQLYLLLHRPFHNPQSSIFLPSSRDRCIKSSSALLNLHRQFCELPRLRHFKWLVNGMTSFNALHGAIALTSCLLGMPDTFDSTPYLDELQATVCRMELLQHRSPVCAKAFPILQHLHHQLSVVRTSGLGLDGNAGDSFENWIEGFGWFSFDFPNSDNWDEILDSTTT